MPQYLPGSFGYEANGRRLRILDAYIEARRLTEAGLLTGQEAMSTSDFPTYIGGFLRRSFYERYTEVSGAWNQYTKNLTVEDFEQYTSSTFGRFPDIPEKSLNGPYEQLAIRELPGPNYRLKEWGAAFSLTRQLIISDRLNKFRDLPTIFAEAMARTISKTAVAVIEANANTYDGNALFSSAHANIGSTALTVDLAGANALIAAEDAIDTQRDLEGYKVINGTDPKVLIYPRELRWIARQLNDREFLPIDVTSGTSVLRPNPIQGRYTLVEELYLTDTNNWYMAVNPTGPQGFLAAVTLNGNTTPFLGVKDPQVNGVLGGDDPYTFDFDELDYKIRHDFDFKAVEWRTVYGAIVS